MFDMKKVGVKLVKLRKEKNFTQMELADKLGISYQAVSNWERGLTMPDISKLPEIAEIFNITIDEFLDYQNGSKIVEQVATGSEESVAENIQMNIGDFEQVSSILKPSQLDAMSKRVTVDFSTEDTQALMRSLPFFNKDISDEMALKAIEEGCDLTEIIENNLPFLSRKVADQVVTCAIGKMDSGKLLDSSIPFINRATADKLVLEAISQGRAISQMYHVIPFVSDEIVKSMMNKALDDGEDMTELLGSMAPLLGKDILGDIIKRMSGNK